ncbi:hypothetical protein BD410DRAFT_847067 [Rickenella mellea]|uniref:Uncharacterized protein n=1 Tax=Rickenella mellea TaxID=50990 RepID=A0A4Y7PDI9_9AGAM|nr:hypothetical protein BD410DRAFT_847067 [Rickenella mellea]
MELAILSTSWKLVRAITEIAYRLEQAREDARSLKYLDTQATTFLAVVTNGLAGVDPAPYLETIASLELEKFIAYGRIKQMWMARKTRRNILNLNRRMRLFVDTYLLQVATETARLNLQAFAEPPPPLPRMSATSKTAMWKTSTAGNPPQVASESAKTSSEEPRCQDGVDLTSQPESLPVLHPGSHVYNIKIETL